MKPPDKWGRVTIPVLVLGIGLLAALPLWGSGFLNTRIVGESPYLLMRVHQLYTALHEGVFPVRWMPDGAYGYGYPFFSFYAALPYYTAAVFHFLITDILLCIKLTQTLGFLMGAAGVYLWTRRHFRHQAASLTAAALFTFAPMHMINIYVRGDSLSEFWAMAMYPLLLWSADRAIDSPHKSRIALFALCYAGLMLSHNISALIFTPLLGLYILWRMRTHFRDWRRWASLIGGLILGLGLSIWFWLPALAERSTLQMGDLLTGFFDWRNNFLDKGLVQSGWLFDYKTDPFRLGLWQTAIVGIGGLALGTSLMIVLANRPHIKKGRGTIPFLSPSPVKREGFGVGDHSHPPTVPLVRRLALVGFASGGAVTIGLWAVISFAISVIMTLSISSWAYEHVPLLPYLQFPWRWLSIAAVAGAVVGAYIVEIWSNRPLRWIASFIVILLTAFSALNALPRNFIPLTNADITPARLNEAEYYSGDIGTTVRADYLPIAVHPRPFSGPAILNERPLKVPDGQATGSITASGAVWQTWQVQITSDQAVVAIPTFYWPGWAATLEDGTPLVVSGIDGLGWIQVSAPRGEHTITFRLGETPIRFAADALSGLAALVWLALVVKALIGSPSLVRPGVLRAVSIVSNVARQSVWQGLGVLFVLIWISALLVVVGLSSSTIIDRFWPTPQAAQFLTTSYRHDYEGILFKDGSLLVTYSYSTMEILPGQSLGINLGWVHPTAHIELIPPMVNIWGYDAALVAKMIPAGSDTTILVIPTNAAPGLYFVRLSVGDDAYDLTPIRILPPDQPDQNVTPSPGLENAKFGDVLRLLNVSTAVIDRGRLNIYLKWNVLHPITRTYGLSVRLRSPTGVELAKSDAQLGVYGAVPPAYWSTIFTDWLSLPGLDGLPPGEGYQMTVALFDGDQLIGQTETRNVTVRDSPVQDSSASPAPFEGSITPQTTEVEQGATLPILCQWRGPVQIGWQVRWAVVSDKTSWETITPLAPGARLDWWQPGQSYKAITPLTIPVDLPPGEYALQWSIADSTGKDVTAVKTAGKVLIKPTSRLFAPPPTATMLPTPVNFGGMIQLWGVQIAEQADKLALHIVWKAIAKPDRDYTYFVHVQRIDAPTPTAQLDTIPRQNNYSTSIWLPGEYIGDEATVSLAGLAPGTYNVWIGWYDPTTGKRLTPDVNNADGRYLIGQITRS